MTCMNQFWLLVFITLRCHLWNCLTDLLDVQSYNNNKTFVHSALRFVSTLKTKQCIRNKIGMSWYTINISHHLLWDGVCSSSYVIIGKTCYLCIKQTHMDWKTNWLHVSIINICMMNTMDITVELMRKDRIIEEQQRRILQLELEVDRCKKQVCLLLFKCPSS